MRIIIIIFFWCVCVCVQHFQVNLLLKDLQIEFFLQQSLNSTSTNIAIIFSSTEIKPTPIPKENLFLNIMNSVPQP